MNVWHLLNNLEEYLCTFLLSVMAFTVLLQVLTRFIFDMPLRWTEELSIYILAWVSFLGASVGIKRWAHIGVEAFVVLLPQRMQRYAKLLSLALCMVFFFIMFFFGLGIVQKQFTTGQVSPAMRIPMYVAYLSVPIGGGFMLIRSIQLFYKIAIKGGDK